jgi:CRP-like cAMP-binding protein
MRTRVTCPGDIDSVDDSHDVAVAFAENPDSRPSCDPSLANGARVSLSSNSPNHFLSSLSAQDSELLQPHLKPAELPSTTTLYKAEDTISRVYFPYTGAVSYVVGIPSGQFVEAGLVGRNSAIGASAVLGYPIALNQAIVQVTLSGVMIEAGILERLIARSQTLGARFARQEQMDFVQVQQTAACNALHTLEARLSRWLLQTRDLLKSDTLPLTQDFLSQMLGVQRSSVTLVARKLQEAGLINYRRGRIHILEVEALQDASCSCYEAINDQFRRLVSWSPDFNNPPVRATAL